MFDKLKKGFEKTNAFLDKHKKAFLVIFLILIGVRIWLFLTMNWQINVDTYYDSRLELNSAISMTSLDWGGEYSKFVLCKGLSFPIFLVILFVMRISYPIGLFILVALASFLFARSLKPVVKNDWVRKLIFLLMLFSPVGMGFEMTYPYRNALMPWVVLIVMACMLAVYLRRKAKIKKLLPWGIMGMMAAGFFWNLREDSIWFLPFILAGAAIMILHYFLEIRKKKKAKNYLKKGLAFSLVAILPVIGILIFNTTISIVNKNVYGVYTTEDRTKTYSAKVLGALIRIDDGKDLEEDYWVSSEALELAKEASPTFKSLDLTPFDRWGKIGDYSIWALRDSVEASGYYKDAKETNDLYKKIYEELEEGFRDGKLKRKGGIQLSDTSGLYSMNEMLKPIGTTFKSLINHVFYNEYEVKLEELKNVKNEGDIVLYENELGINLLRTDEQLAKIGADAKTVQANNDLKFLLKINKGISNIMVKIYNVIMVVLFALAIIGIAVKAVKMFRHKDWKNYNIELLVFAAGIIGVVLFYSYLVGLWGLGYELTADSELFKSYTTPQTVMMCAFSIIGVVCLARSFSKK